jgi:hypothetical protein
MRVDRRVTELEAGRHFPHAPLGSGRRSRSGDLKLEAKTVMASTLGGLTRVREWGFMETERVLPMAIEVPPLEQDGRALADIGVVAVNHDDGQRYTTRTDSRGIATFPNLPPGNYGLRARDAAGQLVATGSARPKDRRYVRPHFTPIASSTAMAHYRDVHRTARQKGRRPTVREAEAFLETFLPELLTKEGQRPVVVGVLRRQVSTGKGRFKPAFQSPRALAEALTAAFLSLTPSAVRKDLVPKRKRTPSS